MPEHPAFPTDTRVIWTATSSSPNPPGTVVNGVPNRGGLILVSWDGLGTHLEDPIHLSLAEEEA
ncbi:hypothetical protein ACT17_32690 [Mycolicibacterium conceptionense]|uniref:Uncharacterized protein n=1 Tax=Mycolicibacterium conceptionense TaxID=451644 RepID=A0A0J8U084_9MYCO|nr:hypothetical protein [Mycolicibacterium conceptionense]KMV13940.1 hypothetical protein ACT17_32690 [Mycolicibacterium conceptionense]